MKVTRYLCVKHIPKNWKHKPKLRLSVKSPSLGQNEIAVKLEIELPDELFITPVLNASIVIPEDKVTSQQISAEIGENIVEQINKSLGVDLNINLIEQPDK